MIIVPFIGVDTTLENYISYSQFTSINKLYNKYFHIYSDVQELLSLVTLDRNSGGQEYA